MGTRESTTYTREQSEMDMKDQLKGEESSPGERKGSIPDFVFCLQAAHSWASPRVLAED